MVRLKKIILLPLLLLCMSVGSDVYALTTIRNISFAGNEETQDLFLRRTIYLEEGDVFDEKRLEDSLQALMDTGLFKDVGYYLASDMPEAEYEIDSQINLVILVVEKHYLLILPRIRIRDNETHVGIQLRWDNVWGMNHRLRYLSEDRGSTAGISESRNEFEYGYPHINGSNFSLGFAYADENGVDDAIPGAEVNRIDQAVSVNVHRWLNSSGYKYGLFANVGWTIRERKNDLLNTPLIDEVLNAVVLRLEYGFSETHDYEFNRSGKEYGYAVDISHRAIHSESEFARHELYYRSYYRFSDRPLDNLNVQTILGHATHDIMGDQAFSLGGDNLRGYDPGRFEGNAMLQINIEYLRPFKNHRRLRYAGFIDLGNTYEDVSDVIHGGLKTGVGVGLRWKIPAFVRLTLRADLGYAISDSSYRVTAGTNYSY